MSTKYKPIFFISLIFFIVSMMQYAATFITLKHNMTYTIIIIFIMFIMFIWLGVAYGTFGFRIRIPFQDLGLVSSNYNHLFTITRLISIINFGINLWLLADGSPKIIDDEHVLQNHGTIMKIISETEYYKYLGHEIRLFVGFPVVIFLMLMLFSLHGNELEEIRDSSLEEVEDN